MTNVTPLMYMKRTDIEHALAATMYAAMMNNAPRAVVNPKGTIGDGEGFEKFLNYPVLGRYVATIPTSDISTGAENMTDEVIAAIANNADLTLLPTTSLTLILIPNTDNTPGLARVDIGFVYQTDNVIEAMTMSGDTAHPTSRSIYDRVSGFNLTTNDPEEAAGIEVMAMSVDNENGPTMWSLVGEDMSPLFEVFYLAFHHTLSDPSALSGMLGSMNDKGALPGENDNAS